jgi:hypothetical protein
MPVKKVTARQVIASKKTDSWHCYVEFRYEDGFSTEADSALLVAAGKWIAKHPGLTLLGMQLEHRDDYTLFYLFLEQ